ncbi:M20 aminoacylase family protein [Pelagibius sp. Alg239-R121]|uniref:M20 aminoacylase family protein n=1 Tax=Pelagibius sp. Alg239-R121 TaxID=2993448 RepID=UPI0024A72AB7|nr:M20 aminoacylase family protein [Pelagibius sp. Alg239-R121]
MTQNSELIQSEMTAWRRDIHKHPELGFNEVRTSDKVAELLESFGLEIHRGIGTTGIVGVLRKGQGNRAIGLRADMDALPIQEANDFAHRSVNDKVFHGCGHDGHTAMLLGGAKHLAESGDFDGTVYFIFQPSEEDGRGALSMIDDGLFERFPMEAVYGMHNMPGIPAGHFAVRKGSMMTSEDIFVITIKGRGGHASMPNRTIDPVVIGAEVVLALQTIASRSVGPQDWCVVSVTEMLTDGARNIIPSEVTIKGDCRALSSDTQELIERRMREIVSGICGAYGAEGHVHYQQDFVATVNSPAETEAAIVAARMVAGEPAVDPDCPTCGASEDFARMLQKKPGCYILIGNGLEGHCGSSLHNPHYDLNDEILTIGRDYWTKLVETQLPAR